MNERTEPDEATHKADEVDAEKAHVADRAPRTDEARLAEKSRKDLEADREAVARHHEEMDEIGANVKGEGAID